MIKTVFVAVSGMLIAAAMPAVAGARTAAPAATPPAVEAPAAPRAAKPTRYCIEEVIVGSRIPQRLCMTRNDWLKEGFDPLAK